MKLFNKKAIFDYEILDRFEAGIALLGPEVKSLRAGHGSLDGAFVRLLNGEAYLINAQIFPYAFAHVEKYDPKRTRKLLFHKKELISIKSKLDSANLTLIPLSWYTKSHRLKLEVGLARGKKQYEKREKLRRETQKRELDREFRGKVK